ncbi:hypothetical protein Pint_13539 [Pistacia integerrima]|uniref:Uncharacterized protein n=1 Tax=Pistacia integerrima TaxID=434235 RepID=A0ACC0Y8L6_9ROSI|nr:hypothetical protein Pint_13539 [Pistacia integerrima]
MLGNRPRPVIGKLSALLVSGNRAAGFLDMGSSPRGPLDLKIQSPRGLKCYDVGGVGLGIVAALEKCSSSSSDGGREILAKFAVCSPTSFSKSSPIPVRSGRNCDRCEMESLEDYTYVTCHGPNKSFTKVYYDGDERKISSGDDRIIKESPARVVAEETSVYPTSEFMSSCNLCRKKLHGKDIYMYRGEKAFCSTECRSRQIMMDERKEHCRSEVSRSADMSSSPYTRDHIFLTGILAI